MESHIDKLLHSIKSLPLEDKVKILYFLELETFESKPGEKEIVPFLSKSSDNLEKWNQEVKELLKENKKFFDELKSA